MLLVLVLMLVLEVAEALVVAFVPVESCKLCFYQPNLTHQAGREVLLRLFHSL